MGIEADVDREKANVRFGARFCIDCGTVMPSVFAVLRLRSSSILLACWTGKSAGFVNCPTFQKWNSNLVYRRLRLMSGWQHRAADAMRGLLTAASAGSDAPSRSVAQVLVGLPSG